MGWFNDFFEGLNNPDYDKMFRERIEKEQKENDKIFDISKNIDTINERIQDDAISYKIAQSAKRKQEVEQERKKEEKAQDNLKMVIDTAKLQCDLCTNPVGSLKVNYNTPTIQGKRTATVKEKNQTSLIFKGNCKKSPNSSSPCASVMQLGNWKDIGTVKFQEEYVLLLKSTIKCNYGGVDVKIIDSAQRNVPTDIEAMPKTAKKEKQILSTMWICPETKEEIRTTKVGNKVSLLVKTKNYKEGDVISVKIKEADEQEINEGIKEITLTGSVNIDGFAELKEEIELGRITKEKSAKEEQQEEDKKNQIYVTYEGKDYTQDEWKTYQNNWHDQIEKRNT